MKKLLAYTCFFLLFQIHFLHAAHILKQPYQAIQPDGVVVSCYISGDEFYNWLHDEDGFTIVCADDGFFYYGVLKGENVVPSHWKVNTINPLQAGLKPWIKIPASEYNQRRDLQSNKNASEITTPYLGTLNNLVIYIKFSDDVEFTTTRQTFDEKFNKSVGTSMRTYYEEVSYNRFTISSTHYPACEPGSSLSYTDSHSRAYFLPYNATSNPIGYTNTTQSTQREKALISDAINWININSPIPADLNIDADNNGRVDNICFVIRGNNNFWGSLLWAHQSQMSGVDLLINSKIVKSYTFHPESQMANTTLCHEMFHALGAHDMYHYDDGGLGISPVSNWDLMETGSGHMGAYMKWKYTEHSWIENIPQIYVSGTYTLNPLAISTNNCYKIASPNSDHEFFMVEYRKKSGNYEGNLPGTGLLVYRIDDRISGNYAGPPDEVYIYRPGGTVATNGNPFFANYSAEVGRTAIADSTQPSCFLRDGSAGGLNIYNITSAGDSISFSVYVSIVQPPQSFSATTNAGGDQVNLEWQKNISNHNVLLAYNTTPVFGTPQLHMAYAEGNNIEGGGTVLYCGNDTNFMQTGPDGGTRYFYKLWSVSDTLAYSKSINADATTSCLTHSLPFCESFSLLTFPNCWSQKHQGVNSIDTWNVEPSAEAGGLPCEMRSFYSFVDDGYTKLITPAINTIGISTLKLRFRHMFYAWFGTIKLRVQSSTDSINWTNEEWLINTTTQNIGPELIETSITHNLNSSSTYIAFVVEGNLFYYEYWFIDDVTAYDQLSPVFTISAVADPVQAGTVTGTGTFIQGEPFTLISTPATGWNFLNWTENGVLLSTTKVLSLIATESRSFVANYSNSQVFVNAVSYNPAGGSVSGTGYFEKGSQVTVIATPVQGYEFSNWAVNGIPVSNDQVFTFSADSSFTVEARFGIIYYRVKTKAFPKQGGTVTDEDVYAYNDPVALLAETASGWDFTGWYENGSKIAETAEYSFAALSNRTLEARFAQQVQVYSIQVTANPSQVGTVSGGGKVTGGNIVTVQAFAKPGWAFEDWEESGNIVSLETTYSFQVNSDRSLTANFVKTISVSAEASPPAGGYITGNGIYKVTDVVTLQAFANEGYKFINWTENGVSVSDSTSFSFIDSKDRSFVAHFQKENGIIEHLDVPVKVFPNPTNGMVCLQKDGSFFRNISVSAPDGREILNFQFHDSNEKVMIDLSSLPKGIYFLAIFLDDNVRQTVKVILQ